MFLKQPHMEAKLVAAAKYELPHMGDKAHGRQSMGCHTWAAKRPAKGEDEFEVYK